MKHFVQWTAPSPLWETALAENTAEKRRGELSRPSILRFATDAFMDDFLKAAENDPKRLSQFLALPETWRGMSPMPDALRAAPAFTRNFKRLGLIGARRKAKAGGALPAANKFTEYAAASVGRPHKLYQPAHQRFYMISACLVCERPGLPDKIPNSGREEKVSYVIRRMFPKTDAQPTKPLPPPTAETFDEYAYVMTDQGARWKKVAHPGVLEADEEQLPLFSVNILEDDGRRRKIFAGVIPTGRREAYMAAGKFSAAAANGSPDPNAPIDSRVYLMRSQFRDPWKNLLQTAAHAQSAFSRSTGKDEDKDKIKQAKDDIVKTSREQIQTISWLVLLDFANFLAANVPRVWEALNNRPPTPALNPAESRLVGVLANTTLDAAFAGSLKAGTGYTEVSGSLKNALLAIKPANGQAAARIEKNLERVVKSYDRNAPDPLYPAFLFPLADVGFNLNTVLDGASAAISPSNFKKTKLNENLPEAARIKDGEDYVNRLAQLVEEALPPVPANQPLQMPPLASQKPMDMREGWFVIRCVYERPLCGTIDPPVLSAPTHSFQIAGFFDPDAPARPIRIALPIDTSPAGLRKFDRNTAFMMSDLLCGQVNRMKGITFMDLVLSVLPFPFHKGLDTPDAGGCKDGGLSIGMMCSLSIPIITICALILLIIIVMLLDFIFKWLPFLMFCFPLPGLKAKEDE